MWVAVCVCAGVLFVCFDGVLPCVRVALDGLCAEFDKVLPEGFDAVVDVGVA